MYEYKIALETLKELGIKKSNNMAIGCYDKEKSIIQLLTRTDYKDGTFSDWKVDQQLTISNF